MSSLTRTLYAKDEYKVEQRLARIEEEVERLKAVVGQQQATKKTPWWHEIAGDFEGDAMFEQIVREGKKLRRRERREARSGRPVSPAN